MKRKINSVLALAIASFSISAYAQQDVTSEYLVNPSFEFSAEGTASTAKSLSSGGKYYGWTLPSLGSGLTQSSTLAIGNSTACQGNAFGIPAASDGVFYYFNRQTGANRTSALTQTTKLPVGKYFITVDYKAYDRSSGSSVGFSINGTSILTTKPFYSASSNSGSYAKNDPWKTVGAWFTVDAEGEVAIAINETLSSAWYLITSTRSDLYLDNVRLYKWDLDDEKNMLAATPATPLDVTAKFVENPFFDSSIEGWSTKYEAEGPQYQRVATTKADAISGRFFENRDGSAFQGSIYQVADDVPAGKYQLQIAAFASPAASEGVSVYLNEGKTDVTSADAQFYTVNCALAADGKLEFGINNEASNVNWIGIDNVSLSLLELKALTLGAPVLSMEATEDVDPAQNAIVEVTFPNTKANTAEAANAKYDITVEYELLNNDGEVVTTGSAKATKGTPIVITIPKDKIEGKEIYTLNIVSAKDSYCEGYEAATYEDAQIVFATDASKLQKLQLVYENRIKDAKKLQDMAIIGVNPFQYLESTVDELGEIIEDAEVELENITNVLDLYEAINRFDKKVASCKPILPLVNEKFLIKHKASGLYLDLTDGVKLSAEGTPVSFQRTENDTWYIYNTPKREYLGYEGAKKGTMTNKKDHDFAITVETFNIHYFLGMNGYLATDAKAEGSTIYGDKGKNANGQWFIEYYTEPEAEVTTPSTDESAAEPTAITSVSSSATSSAIYSANGARTNSMQKGVNIVKKSDGKVVKVVK